MLPVRVPIALAIAEALRARISRRRRRPRRFLAQCPLISRPLRGRKSRSIFLRTALAIFHRRNGRTGVFVRRAREAFLWGPRERDRIPSFCIFRGRSFIAHFLRFPQGLMPL